ncbi:beta-N-acetylhexosaminidase [Agaribacter flavus]|uniref:beta-N-acetylhexosaminidase n=1 Tax=Agaribacter flavus TaxID=1902781 RepID=A0ABV7FVH3_9ALTE
MPKNNIIVGVSGTNLTVEEIDLFRDLAPWGFILFSRNIASPNQLSNLIEQIRQVAQQDEPPVLIDQEGGRVSRLPAPHWRIPPSPSIFAQLYKLDRTRALKACYLNNLLIGYELKQCGININCAPMLDIAQANSASIIHERGLGSTHEQVSALGNEVINGLLDAGVAPVIKHMPGHGRAQSDSHFSLPIVHASKEALTTDFLPFKSLSKPAMAMSAHVVFSAFDKDLPASISPTMYQVMREQIGFDGLIMTDDINMHALSGSIVERATKALLAGADMVLHCSGNFEEMKSLLSVATPLTGKAFERAIRAEKQAQMTPSQQDMSLNGLDELQAQLKVLLK